MGCSSSIQVNENAQESAPARPKEEFPDIAQEIEYDIDPSGLNPPSQFMRNEPVNDDDELQQDLDQQGYGSEVSYVGRHGETPQQRQLLGEAPAQQYTKKTSSTPAKEIPDNSSASTYRFPTPNLLQDAQRAYKGKRPSGTAPPPFPSPTTKEQVFKPAPDADNRARSVPFAISSGPMQDLLNHLKQGAKNDIAKVRAIYVWIAQQHYDGFKMVDEEEKDNAYNKLTMTRAKKYAYTKLFSEMCKCADIPCEKIEGCGKGYDNQDALEFEEDNSSWNGVFVDGCWRLVDMNFGSGGMVGGKDKWRVVDSNLEVKKNEKQEDAKRLFEMNENYFLTDPERFIYNHYPKDPKWQLLARQVTRKEFSEMANVRQDYFNWNIQHMSEPKGYLTTHTGVTILDFTPDQSTEFAFSYALYKNTDVEIDTTKYLNQLVRLENKNTKKKFTITFKEIGLYKLEIYVPVKDGASNVLTVMVSYIIRCQRPIFREVANPSLPKGLQELGPGAKWKSMGIHTPRVTGGIIQAREGCARLQLTDDGSISYLFKLLPENKNSSKEATALPNTTLMDSYNGETNWETNVYLKLPYHGSFLLQVFTANKGETSHNLTSNFIVRSDMKCVTGLFPSQVQGVVGQKGDQQLLKPTTTPHSFIFLTQCDNDLVLQFTTLKDYFFMVKLKCQDGKKEDDLSRYAWFEKVGSSLNCYSRFPHAGTYILGLYAKEKEAMNEYTQIWVYLIEVDEPTPDCQPFPTELKDWKQDMKLVSPRMQNLKKKTAYKVEVEIPGAKTVYVEKRGESQTTNLERKDGVKFCAEVNTLDATDKLVLFTENARQLLYFDVVDDDVFEKLHTEYMDEKQKAATLRAEMESARQRALQEVDDRKKEALEKAKKARDEFEKTKTELFRREIELERKAMEVRFKRKLLELGVTQEKLLSLHQKVVDKDTPDVHRVMRAALLLVGEDDDNIKLPGSCQEVMSRIGPQQLVKMMTNVDIVAQKKAQLAQAGQLLHDVDQATLRTDIPIAGLVYDWARGCLNFHAAMDGISSDVTGS